MQPYDYLNQLNEKGLFTFYRQQQEFQKNIKTKSTAQNLNKILSKALKNKAENHETHKKQTLSSIQRFDKIKSKLQPIIQQKKNPYLLRREIKIKKALLDGKDGLKPEDQTIHSIQQYNSNPSSSTSPLKKSNQICTSQNYSTPKNPSMHFINNNNSQSFSKYKSQFETIRIIKKKKHRIVAQGVSLTDRKSLPPNNLLKNQPSSKSQRQKQEEDYFRQKVSLHFKKLALEPKQFQSGGILNAEDNNKLSPNNSMQRRQKHGLKSYRRQKLQLIRQNQFSNNNKKQSNNISMSHQKLKEAGDVIQINSNETTKLIKIQKLQKYPLNQKISPLKSQNQQNLIFPKLKVNLPQILRSQQNSSEFRSHHKPLTNKQHEKPPAVSSSMSIQILRNLQLKNKYNLKSLQKQSSNILLTKQKMRNQGKSVKQQKVTHHISMRYAQRTRTNENELSVRKNASSFQPINFNQQKQIQMSSSQTQRQIFRKRQKNQVKNSHKQYSNNNKVQRQKSHNNNVIFSLQQEDRTKLQKQMQVKKQQIIQNLLQSFRLPIS